MGFATLVYQGTSGAAASSFDQTAVADPDFSQRNGHYIFTEKYRLLTAASFGATTVRGNFSVPTWNAIGKANIWPVNASAVPPTPGPPRVDTRFDYPPPIPLNEEFQCQISNTGAGEQGWTLLQIITQDWSANLPQGQMPIMVRCTASYTSTSITWSGPQTLTFEQSLRGGVYAVVGAEFQQANVWAFRLIFPRYKLYMGSRKLRPGWLCQNVIGDLIYPQSVDGPLSWGEWGRFHTFEPPQVESIQTAGGAITPEIRLWLVYLGESVSLLDQGLGGGGVVSQAPPMGGY